MGWVSASLLWLLMALPPDSLPPADSLAPPSPPRVIQAERFHLQDTPNDAGNSVTLRWTYPEGLQDSVRAVIVLRAASPDAPMQEVKFIPGAPTVYKDMGLPSHTPFYYRVLFLTYSGDTLQSEILGPVEAFPQWFHTGRIPILLGVVLYVGLLLWFIVQARGGRELFLRKIPGLEAVDEAIGRATEMGRPILYVPGLSTIDDIATIASLNILSHVTRKAAEYETPIIVPNRNPVVYTVAREIVKEAYTSVGRPDLFDPDQVFYVTDSQFGYAAAVSGIMMRDKPATNFLIGMFWAESLILAETGAATGAIQIAGTDAITQLPFFIVACDYTLIGEELYAASAYLSKEPLLMATLKGQDWMKFILGSALVLGSALGLFGLTWFHRFFAGG